MLLSANLLNICENNNEQKKKKRLEINMKKIKQGIQGCELSNLCRDYACEYVIIELPVNICLVRYRKKNC